MHRNKYRKQTKGGVRGIFSKQRNKTKLQNKLSEVEISNLPDKEFNVMVMREDWINYVRTSTKR